ncbi:leucine-rich repeat domain-containing protein [Metabacillus malikii]|uniref:LPXTG-motif cell wall-anchored protein n=1 Tax=Metabacillus malikii TaxID=1504265 RepID=A0ABT9ZHG3_9BACI|nr:leucine-rich repeat domain-containing protein [Metabacillus malikii]MDQ0231420.1 LPXTG-motif cell wall-anchored protein [Metabacillus malikii]
MRKKSISFLLVFTIILSLLAPFSPTTAFAATEEPIRILKAVPQENGILLQWETNPASEAVDHFTLIKNSVESPITSPEVISQSSNEAGTINKVYQYVDTDVTPGEAYKYSIKRNGEEVTSEPISLLFNTTEKLTIKAVKPFEQSVQVHWSEITLADNYEILLDGKEIAQTGKSLSYEIKELQSGQSYKLTIRALQNEQVISEVNTDVETLAASNVTEEKAEQTQTEDATEATNRQAVVESEDTQQEEIVTITDSRLKREIKKALKLTRDELYVTDLETLTELDLSYTAVKDLSGLEKATNLTELNVAGTQITNFAPLKQLTSLKSLYLSDTSFSDLNNISTLTNLEALDLGSTNVTDVSLLSNLTSLQYLDISYLELGSISSLLGLENLNTLSIYGETYYQFEEEIQQLKDKEITIFSDNEDESSSLAISYVKANENSVKLEWEYYGDEDVAKYEVKVANQTKAVDGDETTLIIDSLASATTYELSIDAYNSNNEKIDTFTWTFETLPGPSGDVVQFKDERLKRAIKEEYGIERELVTSDMEAIQELNLDYKRIKDLTGLEAAKNLTYLSVDGNPITNGAPISELTNLTDLYVSNTKITDFSFLSTLQNLDYLSLVDANLTSLEQLPALENLHYLAVYSNQLEDVKGIEQFKALETIDLDYNPLKTIAGLSQLTELETVWLNNTSLDTIDELLKVANLDSVYLVGNEQLKLSEETSAARNVVNQLIENGVIVEFEEMEEDEWFDAYPGLVTDTTIELNWDYYGEQDISTYELYVNGKLHETLSSEDVFYFFEGLSPDTTYEFYVKAFNANGEEVLSTEPFEVTTWSAPTGKKIHFNDEMLHETVKAQLGLSRDLQESDMTKLESLYIFEGVQDLSGLEYATNLYDLYIENITETLDLSPLKNLTLLSIIQLDQVNVKDYSVLNGLKNLNSLTIMNNNLSDLSFISGMTKLYELTLIQNKLEDITPLTNLKKLGSVTIANNRITDLTPLVSSKANLGFLDVSNNPITDISMLAGFNNLLQLHLDGTNVEDLSPLLEMDNLEYVSLYQVDSVKESKNAAVLDKLREFDVNVNTVVNPNASITIDNVTENAVSFSWERLLLDDEGSYEVTIYSYDEDEPVVIERVDHTTLQFEYDKLSPNTEYYIDVTGINSNDEYDKSIYADFKTLPIEGSIKDVMMYVYRTIDVPEADATFELIGLDENTHDIYRYGESDADGQLIDYTTDEALDTFALHVGLYEIVFTTADGEEYVYEFEITSDVEEALEFILTEDEEQTPPVEDDKGPVTPPVNGDKGNNKGNDNDGKKPTTPVKTDTKSDNAAKPVVKPVKEESKNNLPNTATDVYNLLLIGLVVLCIGGAIIFIQRKKQVKNG